MNSMGFLGKEFFLEKENVPPYMISDSLHIVIPPELFKPPSPPPASAEFHSREKCLNSNLQNNFRKYSVKLC